jgi:hypothetical protein
MKHAECRQVIFRQRPPAAPFVFRAVSGQRDRNIRFLSLDQTPSEFSEKMQVDMLRIAPA